MSDFPSSSRPTDLPTAALKVPPHSLEAEQAVLGGLMLNNAAWDRIADQVSDEDFYRRQHQLIFAAVAALAQNGQPFDVVTLSERLSSRGELSQAGDMSYLSELAQNTPSAANIVAYANIVRERALLRGLIDVGGRIADSAFRPDGREAKALLEQAESDVFAIAERGNRSRSGFVPIGRVLEDVMVRVEELYESQNAITGVTTGFTKLDDMTSGLQRSDLVIVAGRPSMGKTSFAMNLVEQAAIKEGMTVGVFSLEMPAPQLAMRMLSSLGRVDQHKLRTGQLADADWPRISSALSMLNETHIYIDDTAGLTPTELRARCRRLKREQDLGMVVIDYLQLMSTGTRGENRATEISEISRSLKALAKEINVPVIALSQLNRSLEQRTDKRPVMSDLRECVPGDTLVVLADGQRVPIAKLVDTAPEVLAVDKDHKVVRAAADKVWQVGERKLVELSLSGGRRLRATEQHLVMTQEGWRASGEITKGQRVALARTRPEPMPPMADGELFWDPVVDVRPAGAAMVYDLTVPGPANWLADGVVCHNSGAIEQDADVILFIYRDEVYNENSEQKGTAEIIIGKQRNGPIGKVTLTFLGQHTRFENFAVGNFGDHSGYGGPPPDDDPEYDGGFGAYEG